MTKAKELSELASATTVTSGNVALSGGLDVDGVTNLDVVDIDGAVDMALTLAVGGAVTASNGLTVDDDGATVLTVDRATSDGTIIDVQKAGTSVGTVGSYLGTYLYMGSAGGADTHINFVNGNVRPATATGAHLDNSLSLGHSQSRWKDLYMSGGIFLGGTGAANKISDYEEGFYTATMTATTSGTITLNGDVNLLAYTKVGRVIHVQGLLETSSKSSPAGAVRISLPVATANLSEFAGRLGGSITFSRGNGAATVSLPFTGVEASSVITLSVDASTVHPGGSPAYSQFYISFTYIA